MKFLKATTRDGRTEYFNMDKILTIAPNGSTTKILMGAGLYWNVVSDSMKIVDFSVTDFSIIYDMEDITK